MSTNPKDVYFDYQLGWKEGAGMRNIRVASNAYTRGWEDGRAAYHAAMTAERERLGWMVLPTGNICSRCNHFQARWHDTNDIACDVCWSQDKRAEHAGKLVGVVESATACEFYLERITTKREPEP